MRLVSKMFLKYFNRKGPFNVMSSARSLDEKGGIERPFILFLFTVFLMDMVNYFRGNIFPWENIFNLKA